ESPFDLPASVKREVLREMESVPFNRYPDDHPVPLQTAIASSLGVEPNSVLVGNGSNELTHTLGLALMAGGRVVLPTPLFALFRSVARLFGSELTEVPPRPDLSFDTEALISAVRQHDPDLTVIATPNNPTGLEMKHADVRRIVEASGGFVLVDEAYAEFGDEPNAIPLIDRYPNVIVMRTLSKGYGLAGLRVGFLVARSSVIQELLKARLPFMIGELAQRTAQKLLAMPELVRDRVETMQKSVTELYDVLAERGLEPVPSKANFVLFKAPERPADFVRRMAGEGILIRDMSGYIELRDYVRVCAGSAAENKAFSDALTKILGH
ncbi:MAG: aminotransferase class I/II-fold pyridoxal phosphate-dependent enzyme, partial [Rhodothermales bacterium]|nr:aminotransferase class I/II-fold pyridoxal phosphate-dependent enzyme [Rhodothermales bacterium]